MNREDLHFWDDQDTPEEEKQTESQLVGISAIQFITTSNITIHTLPLLKNAYLNIFSCKEFDATAILDFSEKWFKGKSVHFKTFERI